MKSDAQKKQNKFYVNHYNAGQFVILKSFTLKLILHNLFHNSLINKSKFLKFEVNRIRQESL